MAKKKKKHGKNKKPKKEKNLKVEIKLKVAKRENFLVLDKYEKSGKGKKKIWMPKFGTPYWLKNSKGVVENESHVLDKHTDMESFGDYIKRGQVLIPKRFTDE